MFLSARKREREGEREWQGERERMNLDGIGKNPFCGLGQCGGAGLDSTYCRFQNTEKTFAFKYLH